MTHSTIHNSTQYYSKYPYTNCLLISSDPTDATSKQVLLLNRQKKPWMGNWNGIGGKLESHRDSTPLIGAQREIREESGLPYPETQITDLRCCGIMEWYMMFRYQGKEKVELKDESEVNEEDVRGMYIFVGTVRPEDREKYISTPKSFDEGILDWKNVDWILDDENLGIVKNVKLALPWVLSGEADENSLFKAYFSDLNVVSEVRFVKDGLLKK
ncbi:hypothetical protein DASC09_011510 [Saccharomycopsis crataegensis]|uniref:Nudix hydrolase domain-containing protein n=1 Tax=Saccharomycopsis crataegensis TaxID=43959 RepID=A0AAV5QGU1_9ASCO|nr:hypothetical protein DASC09_011510 [Saccharomycopsis crataegensis]